MIVLLTAALAFAAEPAMFYRVTSATGTDRLVLADEKGVELGTLFKGETLHEHWSPDGSLVLFNARGPGEDPDSITVTDLKGKHVGPKGSTGESFNELAWSLDGQSVLFANFYSGVRQVGVHTRTEKTICPPLKGVRLDGVFPSPDGKLLAALLNEDLRRWPLAYLMKPDCSEPRPLSKDSDSYSHSHLSWSPDGKRLAWLARWAPDPERPAFLTSSKIVVAELEGLKLRELKRDKYESVSWTGEGKLLTSWSVEKSSKSVGFLGLIDPDTGEVSVLRREAGKAFGSPQWRPREKK